MTESSELSDREIEVLRLVATGASNKQIAQDLSISQNTVKVHIRNIFAKTGVASRTEAAIFAVQTGVIDPSLVPMPESGENRMGQPGTGGWRSRPLWQRAAIAGGAFLLLALILGGAVVLYRSAFPNTAGESTPDLGTSVEDRWQERAPLSIGRSGLALAAYENRIYAIAGESPDGISGLNEVYDPTMNGWRSLQPKPTPVRDVTGVVIGGRIFVPGGILSGGLHSDVLEIYNPSEDRWETGASLPRAISAYAAVAFEGQLYLFGGWDGENYLDTVFRYDPDTDTWESLTPMPTARGYGGAAESGGRIFVIGGTDGVSALRANEEYTPEADESGGQPWRQATPLPEGRFGFGIASLADIIHVIGGEGETSETPPYKYFPQEGRWEVFEDIGSSPWTGLGLVALESDIHAIGGNESGNLSNSHHAFKAIYTVLIPVVQ